MSKRILMIGGVNAVGIAAVESYKSELYIAELKEQFGNDIILVTPEEAKEQGLRMQDFANIKHIPIVAPPMITQHHYSDFKSGKEIRRERRAAERKNKKK